MRNIVRASVVSLKSSRGRWVASLIVLIGVSLLAFAYLRHRMERSIHLSVDRVPLLGTTPMTIVPGLHLLGGLEPAAAYVVETSRGLVLVDSGLRGDASVLKSQLGQPGA